MHESGDGKMEKTNERPSRQLMTKQEVATLLNVTTKTVERMVACGSIPFIRIPCGYGTGTRLRFDPADLNAWLTKCRDAEKEEKGGTRGGRNYKEIALDLMFGV